MREILFRGKTLDNSMWVIGNFVQFGDRCYIFISCEVYRGVDDNGLVNGCRMVKVIPETVGQYIGADDMHGKRIFEGDIIHCDLYGMRNETYTIDFGETSFSYTDSRQCLPIDCNEYGISVGDFEIIGNIYDNPELLKGEKE